MSCFQTIIVHISGPSGSGKSTLGIKIAESFPSTTVAVKDTDEFIQDGNPESDELLRLEKLHEGRENKEYIEYWRNIWDHSISDFIISNENKLIVFVGLTDNCGPPYHYYNINQAHYRFYIKIDKKELLKRYYTRFIEDTKTKPVWEEIIQQRRVVCSSYDIIGPSFEKERDWHHKNGYNINDETKIMEDIKIIFENTFNS